MGVIAVPDNGNEIPVLGSLQFIPEKDDASKMYNNISSHWDILRASMIPTHSAADVIDEEDVNMAVALKCATYDILYDRLASVIAMIQAGNLNIACQLYFQQFDPRVNVLPEVSIIEKRMAGIRLQQAEFKASCALFAGVLIGKSYDILQFPLMVRTSFSIFNPKNDAASLRAVGVEVE